MIEAILDDDDDMQDMYLGRRAAAAAVATHQVTPAIHELSKSTTVGNATLGKDVKLSMCSWFAYPAF